jgi:3-hydroxybutyryl-CoA dehydratase
MTFPPRRYEDIQVGDKAYKSVLVDEALLSSWASLTGDLNPVHMDEEYASQSFFRRRVAHGLLPASLIGAILGNELPGPGSIYLSQSLEFKGPVYLGDQITAAVTVMEKDDSLKKFRLQTEIVNQRGQTVLTGEAFILFRPIGSPPF